MKYDAVIIGAGVAGCAVAMELSRYRLKLCVVERGEDVCVGTSKANSAIVHAGFDARPGTLMARYNVEGNRRMTELCRRLDIPYKVCGALVLCFDEAERSVLAELLERGHKNGVEGVRIVEREELRELEKNVSPQAVAALWAPTSGIVCPFELTAAMAENAARNGCDFFFDREVTGLKPTQGGWLVETAQGSIESRCVINAAGVYADVLHNMVSADKVEIVPRRGEYCLLDKKAGRVVEHTLFQLPTGMGKGILVTPTVHGNTLVGPTAEDLEDKEETETSEHGLQDVMKYGCQSVPSLPRNRTITSFAGLRAHLKRDEHDFIVGAVKDAPGVFDVIGIESPGLTAAPAIGADIAAQCAAYLGASEREDYDPYRDEVIRPEELSFEERQALIREKPEYGQIVCRCERVSEGEILAAIRRKPGARSLDGVKRRTRAGMGRCQSGFCAPRVMELLEQELGVAPTELSKNGGAPLLVGWTREEDEA